MKPGLNQSTQLRQELKINPRLYQAMDLLYMPLLDLQQHLKQELLNNPFLDLVEAEEDEVRSRKAKPPSRRRQRRKTSGRVRSTGRRSSSMASTQRAAAGKSTRSGNTSSPSR